ncbi:MAG: hypothetical protein Q8N05_00330 [Bacteroidota bacterium]|nr:hypothetical protein [Bacteroidota bacterium]
MKKLILILFVVTSLLSHGQDNREPDSYRGKYCSGTGDANFLRLIDESFAFFHPNPVVPNLTMLYNADWDTFTEGAGWGAWWIQNSYGFSYAATPFLQEPWASILQRSWDLFWDNQGDGIRKGLWGDGTPNQLSELVAPDGGLGDTAAPGKIIYKQGDGNVKMHDWFYEATAAALVMQSEILLVNRDKMALSHYLPKMERACNFIERARDPKNNLFLVGPACNLLAPSYGGVKQADGTFGKGYLTGVSITYLAALDRMVELYKLAGDQQKLKEFEHRQKIIRESLPQLMTTAGYFVKSVEPNGIKHGVLGQKQFGYLEGVANADAVALRVVDNHTAQNIYKQIEVFPAIRPFDFLLTNAPGLDDTYGGWGNTSGKGLEGFWTFGDWVNGGAWGTVEGRAILMYYRLGKFEDIRRSAIRAMKWAKDFRMDAPWSQQGENTHNPWSDSGKFRVGGVAVMVDNFAIPAATIRGLYDCDYRSDRLILRPRIPASITQYNQNEPIFFGKKKIYISCLNGGPKVKLATVNGKGINTISPEEITLLFVDLPEVSKIEIITEGGWPKESPTMAYPEIPSILPEVDSNVPANSDLPESLKTPFSVLLRMKSLLSNEKDAEFDQAFVTEAIKSCEDSRVRSAMDPGPGYFRPLTPERIEGINKFYEQAALSMYNGFAKRMANYTENGNDQQKRMAAMFYEAQK